MNKDLFKFSKALIISLLLLSLFAFVDEKKVTPPQMMLFIGSIAEPFANEGVFVGAKAYTPRESLVYLNRDLLHKGFEPIQVTIQNNSSHTYYLSQEGIQAPLISAERVAFIVTRSSIPRSIAFKVIGVFFWPALIPGTIDSLVTLGLHKKMTKDYRAKSIKAHGEAIPPFATVHRVLFLPKGNETKKIPLSLRKENGEGWKSFDVIIQRTC